MPLLSRDRYTDDEWQYATSGRCDWAEWPDQHIHRCGLPSDPNSHYRYCKEHDDEARDDPTYGK
jgi:hypothetical protein